MVTYFLIPQTDKLDFFSGHVSVHPVQRAHFNSNGEKRREIDITHKPWGWFADNEEM